MSQIKPMPVHIREYYKAMREAYTQRKEELVRLVDALSITLDRLHNSVAERYDALAKYNIDLSKYTEFINNEYENGSFLRLANGAYLNKPNDYELVADLYELLKLAKEQKEIYDYKKEIEFIDRCLAIKPNDYIRIIRTYFQEVHKHLILKGEAYSFGKGIGDLIINRVRTHDKAGGIDYAATKAKREEILARGGRLYDPESEAFAKANGLEYTYEDPRVYKNSEYFYEVILAWQKYTNCEQFVFTPQDYRSVEVRGKTNKMLAEECNGDLNKVCELPVDLKTKLAICLDIDKTLYTNFIRNEGQTSYRYAAVTRKGR